MTWIDLESSKGLCPMCRQSMHSLNCLSDTELTFLQNSNGRTRNNCIIRVSVCVFFFFLLINGYQGVVGRIRDTPLCFYRAFKLELEELMGPQSQLSIKLMPWLERLSSIGQHGIPPGQFILHPSTTRLFLLGRLLFTCNFNFFGVEYCTYRLYRHIMSILFDVRYVDIYTCRSSHR